MNEFNVRAKCDICNQNKLCTEAIVITKDKQQKVEFWCKECVDKILEEEAKQQELDMQDTYESIIRGMR